ncbi:peptide-methionine (S)-S-oxide reductase [Veronia nyctiphanis]|uniref:peptide-methionine (S)-S-oxide reductase n=1 Tax=Veronia nyctiphanis TaxID=1278244 RepID=UPI00191C0681|nr:peptide-methionine (S)-S-oxide reductase [Veronia nyctiphanis]
MKKVGLGGSCHWCTEAIFQSLKGVVHVNQGWLSPATEPDAFSEGVIVSYDESKIPLDVLIEIHVYT